jgi:glycine hydroxymethyltransferase
MNLVEALRAGEPVIIPTDTVYGLAATAQDPKALERLYRLKDRDPKQPSALLAPDVDTLLAAVPELDERVLRALLPGPYTLILPNPARRFSWLCGDTPEKIGVRVPELPEEARRALERAGPVVATSANAPGGPDPARVEDVPAELRAAAAAILDAGELPGTPSTVLDLTGVEPKVLRAGAGRSIPVMSIAQETFQHLTTAGLADVDPDVAALLGKELERQRGQIELIASENFTWPSILEAVGSVPTNKYAEGYPGKRYYGGCEVIDEIEQLAIDRAKELFGAEHANVQPHAGAQTNMAVYMAVLQPGDTILSLRLDHGGHLTHGLKVNFSGRLYTIVGYGVSRETMTVDYDEVLGLAKEHRPKLIVCGGSAYPRTVETDKFREIADEVGALLLCDMAHFAGLVAAGLHPNPVEHCDFVTSTTHKTLAGPRSGFILCREEHAVAVDRAIFPGIQGGPLEHTIAAKATCFRIAMTEAFREYQRQIRANADVLAETLQEGGLDILTGGTDTHLMQVDLRDSEWTGKAAEERLHDVRITVNRNTVPFDERPPTVASGIRIGTPAMTMRGFDEEDFRETGRIIVEALAESPDLQSLRARVDALCAKRPLYAGFRGYTHYA